MRSVTFFSGGGHVALSDAHGEALHHRGLSDARLADEDRVVLPPAGQDVHDLPHLEIAPQHRVDFALLGLLGEIDGVLIQVRRLAAGLRGRAPPLSPHGGRACRSSAEFATMLANSLRRSSGGIFWNSRLTSRISRLSSVVRGQSDNGMAGADLTGAEVRPIRASRPRSASGPGSG